MTNTYTKIVREKKTKQTTQVVTKLKNYMNTKLKNLNCNKTQKLAMGQNSKFDKLKKKLTLWQITTTQIVTKLNKPNCHKPEEL